MPLFSCRSLSLLKIIIYTKWLKQFCINIIFAKLPKETHANVGDWGHPLVPNRLAPLQ